MAKTGDRKGPFESGAAGKSSIRGPSGQDSTGVSELNTHKGDVDFASLSATIGIPELEQILKHKTFTRSEAQHLIALVRSRTNEESPSPSTTSDSLKKHKHGVVEEQILSPQHPATMENLPDELLTNIFIRLLAKQLAQMRSVSKSWNALLSQSSFIKSHLYHSIHNKDQILLVFHDEEKFSFDIKPLTAIPTRSPSLELTNFIKLPINPQPERINGIKIIGSVNGLICSRYGDSIIHIWNPSLSAILTLPPYSTPSRADNKSIRTYFQFGYDPKTDDYKVVKLTGLHGPNLFVIKWWLQIEIYSMRKGSWELITERFPSHVAVFNEGKICIHSHEGHLHWIGYTKKDDSESIVAFDLGSATFSEIPLPDSTLDSNRFNEVGVLADKLYVLSCIREHNAYEVWVMDRYGVAESWVKRFVFPQFADGRCPFGFTLKNEFLIEHGDYLVLYDPFTDEEKFLDGYCPVEQCIDKIVEYVESLVWVAPV